MTSPAPAPMVDLDAIRKTKSWLAGYLAGELHSSANSELTVQEARNVLSALSDALSHIDSLSTPVQVNKAIPSMDSILAEMAGETAPVQGEVEELRKQVAEWSALATINNTLWQARAETAEASAAALKLRVVELEVALRPFADAAELDNGDPDGDSIRDTLAEREIRRGDLRDAAKALRPSPKPTEAQREGGVPDAKAQTPAPGLRERIARIIDPYAFALGNDPSKHRVDYAPARNDALKLADAILAITDPQTVRKAALEEAAKDIEDRGDLFDLPNPDDGPFTQQDKTIAQCQKIFAARVRALAASPAPTTPKQVGTIASGVTTDEA